MKRLLVKTKIILSSLFSTDNKNTYWQKTYSIVGPAMKEDFSKTGQKETRNAIEKFILKHSNVNTLLLDAGCNTGIEGYRLFKKGYKGRYVGVDSNNKAIQYAEYNLSEFDKANLFVSDLNMLDFPDKHFDLVLVKDVIEHQRDHKSLLSELTRVTKKYLLLSLFIKLSSTGKDKIKLHPDGYYLNKYSKEFLFKFLFQKGFSNKKIIYSNAQDDVLVFQRV